MLHILGQMLKNLRFCNMTNQKIENLQKENEHLKNLIRNFFEFLDRTDESENGRVFHPVSIGCCRAAWMEPLDKLLKEMKNSI